MMKRNLHSPNEGKGLSPKESAVYRKQAEKAGSTVKTDILLRPFHIPKEDCSQILADLERKHPKLHDLVNKRECMHKLMLAAKDGKIGEKEDSAYSTGFTHGEKEELFPANDTELAAYALGVLHRGENGKHIDNVRKMLEKEFADPHWGYKWDRNPWNPAYKNNTRLPKKPGDGS